MSAIEDLIGELNTVGTVDSVGEFTLDRNKAREKMRNFALAEPRTYVLELVQAAVLKGARNIRFDIDASDMRMVFDGEPFSIEDFENVYDSLFSKQNSRLVMARRELALGINSAMALGPKDVIVESGDGTTGARLILKPEEDDDYGPMTEEAPTGTRIHVRERFRWDTFGAFFRNLQGTLPEEVILRQRCLWANVAIDLEDTIISYGITPRENLIGISFGIQGVHIEGHGVAGYIIDQTKHLQPRLEIVTNGVWLTTHSARISARREENGDKACWEPGFVAVVDCSGLTKDASQREVVDNPAYRELLGVVADAHDQVIAKIATMYTQPPGVGPQLQWWIRTLLWEVAKQRLNAQNWQDDDNAGLFLSLRQAPLWRSTYDAPLTIEDAAKSVLTNGTVDYCSSASFEGLCLDENIPIFNTSSSNIKLLEQIFPNKVRDATPFLRRRQTQIINARAFRARKVEPRLRSGLHVHRIEVSGEGYRGELGVSLSRDPHIAVQWIIDGCLLAETRVPCMIPGLVLAIEADFAPDAMWQDLKRDNKAMNVVVNALEHLPQLLGELTRQTVGSSTQQWIHEVIYAYFASCVRHKGHPYLTVMLALGFSAQQLPKVTVDKRKFTADLERETPPLVCQAKIFERCDGETWSLVDLFHHTSKAEPLLVVTEKEDKGFSLAALKVRNDGSTRTIINYFIAGVSWKSGADEMNRLAAKANFMKKETLPSRLNISHKATGQRFTIRGNGIEGELFIDPTGEPAHISNILVLYQGRPATEMPLYLPPQLSGVVEAPHLTPDNYWKTFIDNEEMANVRRCVAQAVADAIVEITKQPSLTEAAFLRECLALMFPTMFHHELYTFLKDNQKGWEPFYRDILGMTLASVWSSQIHVVIRDFLSEEEPSEPTLFFESHHLLQKAYVPQDALALIDLLFPKTKLPPHEQALEPIAELKEAKLFRWYSGEPVSLGDLIKRQRKTWMLHYAKKPNLDGIVPEEAIIAIRDERELMVLRRIFGKAMFNGQYLITQARRKHTFLKQKTTEAFTLAAGDALVQVPLPQSDPREGEVGLAADHSGGGGTRVASSIHIHIDQRFVELTSVPLAGLFVASVHDTQLKLNATFKSVLKNDAFKAMVTSIESTWPQLVALLLEQWESGQKPLAPSLHPLKPLASWFHLLDYATAQLTQHPWSVAVRDELVAKIVNIRTIAAPGGSWISLAEIHAAHGSRQSSVPVLPITKATQSPPEGFEVKAICPLEYELVALTHIFNTTISVSELWEQAETSARNWAKMPPFQPLNDTIVEIEFAHPLFKGKLSLPQRLGGVRGVQLVVGGKCLERAMVPPFKADGFATGSGIQFAPDGSGAEISPEFDVVLANQVARLYLELLNAWSAGQMNPRTQSMATHFLSEAVKSIRRDEVKGIPPHQMWKDFYRQARLLPILQLRNGRFIDLDTALEELPTSLDLEGLWVFEDAERKRSARTWKPYVARPISNPPAQKQNATSPRTPSDPSPPFPPFPLTSPKPSSPTAGLRIINAIRAELRLVRNHNHALLSDTHLDMVRVGKPSNMTWVVEVTDSGVLLNASHPLVEHAAAGYQADPVRLSFVTSAVYTALNLWRDEITNPHEAKFHELLGKLVASAQ